MLINLANFRHLKSSYILMFAGIRQAYECFVQAPVEADTLGEVPFQQLLLPRVFAASLIHGSVA